MKIRRWTFMILGSIFYSTSSYAYITQAKYEDYKKKFPDITQIYISAIVEGLNWTNGERGNTKLYCLPENIAFNAENYSNFIEEEFSLRANASNIGEMPVGLALLRALERKFPCKK